MNKIDINTSNYLRNIDIGNIALEQDIRAIWGDKSVDALLDVMDFKSMLSWMKESNEWFNGNTPCQAFSDKGEDIILEFVNHHKEEYQEEKR